MVISTERLRKGYELLLEWRKLQLKRTEIEYQQRILDALVPWNDSDFPKGFIIYDLKEEHCLQYKYCLHLSHEDGSIVELRFFPTDYRQGIANYTWEFFAVKDENLETTHFGDVGYIRPLHTYQHYEAINNFLQLQFKGE